MPCAGWFSHEDGYSWRPSVWGVSLTHGLVEPVRTDDEYARLIGWCASASVDGREGAETLPHRIVGPRADLLFDDLAEARAAVDAYLSERAWLLDLSTDEQYDPSYELDQDES